MTNFNIIGTLNINNCNLLGDFSRIVDVAVLESEEITSPKELDAHIISLDGIRISISKYLSLFHSVDGNMFCLNEGRLSEPELSLKNRTIHSTRFHLVDAIMRYYGIDLGVELDCLDPCSTIEISNQLHYYKNLGDFCRVKCAMTFNQIIETIVNRTDFQSKNWTDVFGNYNGGVDTQITRHVFVINIRFYNANPAVRDIIIKMNYIVEFRGEKEVMCIVESLNDALETPGYNTYSKDGKNVFNEYVFGSGYLDNNNELSNKTGFDNFD